MSATQRQTRILLVEDNSTNQEVAKRILQHLGYESVRLVEDGSKALAALAEADFDLVLMDCHLPGMDGYETARRIRDPGSNVRDHDIAIVATTAAAMESDREKCLAAGMNGHIAKPLRFAELRMAIEQWGAVTSIDAASSAANPGSTPFDSNEFDQSVMGNDFLARRILRTFVDDMPRQIALLAQAVSAGDAPQVRMVAHSIKGAAASVSGREMRDASWKLEQQGRDGNLTGAASTVRELSASFERARVMMDRFCQEERD